MSFCRVLIDAAVTVCAHCVVQVWRMYSASFSHVDLLHLAMNMMSLYQVGWLEEYYGSFLYAVVSFMLVTTTMLVSYIMYHVMITRFNRVSSTLPLLPPLRCCASESCRTRSQLLSCC